MTIYSGVISCREEDPCDQLKGALNWLTAPLVLLVMKQIQGMNSHFWDGLFQGLCSVLLVGILHDLIQTWKNYLNKFFEKWKAQPDDTNHPSSICGSSVATLRFASIHEIQQQLRLFFGCLNRRTKHQKFQVGVVLTTPTLLRPLNVVVILKGELPLVIHCWTPARPGSIMDSVTVLDGPFDGLEGPGTGLLGPKIFGSNFFFHQSFPEIYGSEWEWCIYIYMSRNQWNVGKYISTYVCICIYISIYHIYTSLFKKVTKGSFGWILMVFELAFYKHVVGEE